MANKNKNDRRLKNRETGIQTNALYNNVPRMEEPKKAMSWKERFSERNVLGVLYCISGASLGFYITSFQKGPMWFPLLGMVFILIDNGRLHLKYNRIRSSRKWEITGISILFLMVMSLIFFEDITRGLAILALMLGAAYILTIPLLWQDSFLYEDSKRARNRLRKLKKHKETSEEK